ncbi:hypothetical protein EXQ33_06640 [Clostridium botulinum]|nr:hypothetical protein [Clostridium botulinum]
MFYKQLFLCGLKKYNLKSNIKTGGAINVKDLVGKKFGKLTVLKLDNIGIHGKEYLCICECGNKKVIRGSSLTSGVSQSCGCQIGKGNIGRVRDEVAKNRIGEKFNNLLIIGIDNSTVGINLMICKCDCGNITKQIYADLKTGKVKSCGCYQKEQASKTGSTIGLDNYKNDYNWYYIKNGEKIKCRSGFEVIYVNYLIKNNINFRYEPKCFKLDNGKRYTPDFYLIDENKYIEIKGSFKMNKSHQEENVELFKINHKWDVLYWGDIVKQCNLHLKTYNSYLRRARKLNIKEEDYLANMMYL